MAVTSGIHAGRMAAHYCASLASAPEPDEAQIQRIHERVYAPLDPERSIGWKEFEMTLQRILTEGAGPCRTEKKLLRAKEKLEQVQAASRLDSSTSAAEKGLTFTPTLRAYASPIW